jgi:antitoxin (DNA-binding transcriptional repressor) of toxin-antitoxin stability system
MWSAIAMEATISPWYLAKHLKEVLRAVREQGDIYTIADREGNIARLGPIEPPKGATLADLARELAKIPWPDPEYFDELERIHKEMNEMPLEITEWPS